MNNSNYQNNDLHMNCLDYINNFNKKIIITIYIKKIIH